MSSLEKSGGGAERLTSSEFWDSCYESRNLTLFDAGNWKDLVSIQIVRLLETLQLDQKDICEVGGGDAALLAYLAKQHPCSTFSIIDFSPAGCELAQKRAEREDVTLNIYLEDVFAPPPALLNNFDLVISHGVVEHFSELASVMEAKSRLLKEGGKAFTLIPNFSSPIYAYLCKRWSRTVYEDHVPHDMRSFLAGHERAGLIPLANDYLGAIEFGMLSMAMADPEQKTWFDRQAYLYLSRLSKAVHFLEHKTSDFPVTKLFSPFMYVISVKSS
jgi:2-polyprenyl-3-methyl-5-hydroxy-6-metoxy-1,4-benzoquinol methylase